eukprot:gene21932-28012_t
MGEELTFSYDGGFNAQFAHERRSFLLRAKEFICECPRCSATGGEMFALERALKQRVQRNKTEMKGDDLPPCSDALEERAVKMVQDGQHFAYHSLSLSIMSAYCATLFNGSSGSNSSNNNTDDRRMGGELLLRAVKRLVLPLNHMMPFPNELSVRYHALAGRLLERKHYIDEKEEEEEEGLHLALLYSQKALRMKYLLYGREQEESEEQVEDLSYLLDSKIEDSLQNYSSRMSSSRLSLHVHDTNQDLEHEEDEDEGVVRTEGGVDESFDTCDEGVVSEVEEEEEHLSFVDCSFTSVMDVSMVIEEEVQEEEEDEGVANSSSSSSSLLTGPLFTAEPSTCARSVYSMSAILEETSPAIAAQELSMYIEAEAEAEGATENSIGDESDAVNTSSVSSFQPTPSVPKKSLTFVESANPFQRLVSGQPLSKTPSKIDSALSARMNWKSSTKPIVFSHGTSSSALPKTPRSAVKRLGDTPNATSSAANRLPPKAPKIAPRLTKAQQLRQDAAKAKLDSQSRQHAEEETKPASFQFAPNLLTASLQVVTAATASEKAAARQGSYSVSHTAVAPSSKASVVAAAIKTPQSINPLLNKGRKSTLHASAVAGSAKRKLLDAPSSISSTVSSSHQTATDSAVKRQKSSAPDFARMHANQFSNSKSISSMISKTNKSQQMVASKMTAAMDEALNGPTQTALTTTASSSSSSVVGAKKVTATPAVAAPTNTSHSAVRRHVSMLVPAAPSLLLPADNIAKSRSSLAPTAAAVSGTSRTPLGSSSSSSKTPLKSSARSTFGGSSQQQDKENACPMSVRNKFVSQRSRGGANIVKPAAAAAAITKVQSISVEHKRAVRRASFLEETNDKRRQS